MTRPSPTHYIRQTRDNYEKLGFEPYQWFAADTPPAFTLPAKPLTESRLGMISTAGTYVHGQVAYYYKDDTSIRGIPRDTPVTDLRFPTSSRKTTWLRLVRTHALSSLPRRLPN